MSVVRDAVASDLDACAEMANADEGRLAQGLAGGFFLVAEWAGAPVGFLIASRDGVVEDFHVEVPALWPSVGQHLLREARTRLKVRGVTRIVARSGEAVFLKSEGFSRTTDGWTAAV